MRIQDLLSEERAAVAPKPPNFVAKHAKKGGAGQHKDKKKAEKQGDVKHKKELATMEAGMYTKPGSPSAYDRDYRSSVSGMGKKDSLAYQQDGGANDEGETDAPYQAAQDKPVLKGYYFYNVKPGQEDDAGMYGVKKTKSGKWAKAKYSTSGRSFDLQKDGADKAFGQGNWWSLNKNEGVAEGDNSDVADISDSDHMRIKGIVDKKYPGYELSGLDMDHDGNIEVEIYNYKTHDTKHLKTKSTSENKQGMAEGLDHNKRQQLIQFLVKKLDWEANYLELATDAELIKWCKNVQAGKKPMGY